MRKIGYILVVIAVLNTVGLLVLPALFIADSVRVPGHIARTVGELVDEGVLTVNGEPNDMIRRLIPRHTPFTSSVFVLTALLIALESVVLLVAGVILLRRTSQRPPSDALPPDADRHAIG